MVSPGLPDDFADAHNFGDCHCADDFNHIEPRAAATIRASQKNCALDLAVVDVCFRVRRDLLESLRTRRVNHKFHYDSVKQTQKWLALHQVYSPSRNDADCQAIYEQSFA